MVCLQVISLRQKINLELLSSWVNFYCRSMACIEAVVDALILELLAWQQRSHIVCHATVSAKCARSGLKTFIVYLDRHQHWLPYQPSLLYKGAV